MSIRKCAVPPKTNRCNLADIYAFIASGWNCAEVELCGRSADIVYRSLRNAIQRKGFGIKAIKRGKHVYLAKVVGE